ncbi:glycosyltransferase [Robbsia andropogonis]|uniref:glycosyltransferase n=1 Tax=Robbsia andropogonis TaxID=28092 RepID=UPI0020A0993C|nr:hypothetical protein [Robbsia andropogonis]MCP1129371.1 hypothetical protein [Robbsia andropogonis]
MKGHKDMQVTYEKTRTPRAGIIADNDASAIGCEHAQTNEASDTTELGSATALRQLPTPVTMPGTGYRVEEPRRNLWHAGESLPTLQATDHRASANEEIVIIPGCATVRSGPNILTPSHMAFFEVRSEHEIKPVIYDTASGKWCDADDDTPIDSSAPTDAMMGALTLFRPRCVAETFPDARPIPKIAYSFWVGAPPPKHYLKKVRHNAKVLRRSGYRFALILDTHDPVGDGTEDALKSGIWPFKRSHIQIERWRDTKKTLRDFCRGHPDRLAMITAALENYRAISHLGIYAGAADIARYLLLFQRGGLYIDMDDALPGGFDGVLLADSHMVWSPLLEGGPHESVLGDTRSLANNMLAAQAGSPIMARALSLSNERLANGGLAALTRAASPGAGLRKDGGQHYHGGQRALVTRERAQALFINTGPVLLHDAAREVAPGFVTYLERVDSARKRAADLIRDGAYQARLTRTMLPLDAAYEVRTETGASWDRTPVPFSRRFSRRCPPRSNSDGV